MAQADVNSSNIYAGGNVSFTTTNNVHNTNSPPPRSSSSSHQSELPSQLYSRLLMREGRGYPLMIPSLPTELPAEYQRDGVMIGDVGAVMEDGYFDVFFNICEPAQGSINGGRVPEGFVTLPKPPHNRDTYRSGPCFPVGGCSVSDTQIQVDFSLDTNTNHPNGYRYQFQRGSEEGAVLALPLGASKKDLQYREEFRTCAIRNGICWYEFVKRQLGRDVENGSIYLITGYDKAKTWGTASFFANPTLTKPEILFTNTGWHPPGRAYTQAEPNPKPSGGASRENQCVFLRGYKVTLSTGILANMLGIRVVETSCMQKGIAQKDQWGFPENVWKIASDFFHAIYGNDTSINPARLEEQSGSNQAMVTVTPNVSPLSPEIHPSSLINLYLLSKFPESDLAVTHDSVWCSYFNAQLHSEGRNQVSESLLKYIDTKYTVIQENGSVYLEDQPGEMIVDKKPDLESAFTSSVLDEPTRMTADNNMRVSSPNMRAAQEDISFGAHADQPRLESKIQTVNIACLGSKDINNDARQTQTVFPQRDPIEILQQHVAFEALYDSAERFDLPKCHLETRTAVLDRIEQWAYDTSEDVKPILWLSGSAGAGKSAIAQTLVERWKSKNALVIACFFWRTASERNQKTRLVPTLAFQLLKLFPSMKTRIEAALRIDGFFRKRLSFQLEKLVIEPLLSEDHRSQRVIMVIDGLDKCCANLPREQVFSGQYYESQPQEILEAFGYACQKTSSIRLMIASRPERQIRSSFGTWPLEELTISLFLEDTWDVSADLRLFLNCRFERIRKRYGIEPSWPTEDELSTLVQKSSGQFIYPSTVVKHITRPRANPKQSLKAILELHSRSGDNPLAELDMLYTLVLESVAKVSLRVVTDILGYMLLSKRDNADLSIIYQEKPADRSLSMFRDLLFLPGGEAEPNLDDLRSVLDIPLAAYQPIRFISATFSEYLQDNSRAGNFFISDERVSIRYTELIFRHLYRWGRHPEGHTYNGRQLVQSACCWVNYCPPSRSLMVHVWSLMRIKLGHYPLADSDGQNDYYPPPSEQLSTHFDLHLRSLDKASSNSYTRILLKFLQGCNIPEIEPFWLRRYLVRRRLEAVLEKHPIRN